MNLLYGQTDSTHVQYSLQHVLVYESTLLSIFSVKYTLRMYFTECHCSENKQQIAELQ